MIYVFSTKNYENERDHHLDNENYLGDMLLYLGEHNVHYLCDHFLEFNSKFRMFLKDIEIFI